MRRLVVAPHADDEILGCGGLIAKYPDTAVAVVARTNEVRKREFQGALSVLGHDAAYTILDFPDGEIGTEPAVLVEAIDRLLWAWRPEEVYLPYPGVHQDHIAVYQAGMRACRQSLNPAHWMPPSVLIYETPVYDLDMHAWPLRFNVFESLTANQVDMKRKAMSAYDSQTRKPHAGSPDELVVRARSLGLARNLEYAEQFAAVRVVR